LYLQPFFTTEAIFSLPSLETDVTDYGSPASSTMDYINTPILAPDAMGEDPWCIPPSITDGLGNQQAPFLSTYSSLTGWAGSEEPRCMKLGQHTPEDISWQNYSHGLQPGFHHAGGVAIAECAIYA
jgi:hypothetical protein